jgi:cytochrome c-type biogenesis protein CcmH/NrfG
VKARDLNEQGLSYLKDGRYSDAVRTFQEASRADLRNVNIIHNLGFAYMSNGDFDNAEKVLLIALTFSPGNANAWATLAQDYAKQDGPAAAVACFANAYRFSRKRDVTRQFLQRKADDEDVRVKNAVQQALQLSLLQTDISKLLAMEKGAEQEEGRPKKSPPDSLQAEETKEARPNRQLPAEAEVQKAPILPNLPRDYFTIGSTKDEVVAVQGTPDSFSENKFQYGSSDVHFQNGRVISWYNGYPRLKVKMLPGQFGQLETGKAP